MIRPQPGFQEKFLSSTADIVIGGGAAGAGKSFAMLLECLRWILIAAFGAVVFRRTSPQITNQGGLWDTSMDLYQSLDVSIRPQPYVPPRAYWLFPSGARVKFSHLQHEKDAYEFQGAQIPLICFDELTHFCMHPDTEVLTEKGWMKIADVPAGLKVASLSPERNIEYMAVEKNHSFDYDGDLIGINQKQGVSFRVTPNHRTVVDMQNAEKSWKFVRADKLETTIQNIPRIGNWEGGELVEYYELPKVTGRGHGKNSNQVDRIKMNDWLEFLGWYFAEGCAFEYKNRTGTPKVAIRQMKQNASLISLFERLPFRSYISKDGQYSIFSRQLYNYVKPLGSLYDKRIPRWIFGLPKHQIKIFFDAFVQGDGHVYGKDSISFGLANSGLIDDLQEMCFLLGRIATKSISVTKTGFTVYRLTVSGSNRSATQTRPKDVFREKYNGKVYCLTVPKNHTFYCRLNGRASWTGNTSLQFWYLLSRNRSMCGVKPYMRCTTNPQSKGWVKDLIQWWLYPDDYTDPTLRGYPIPERDGVVRYVTRYKKKLVWGDTRQQVLDQIPPESVADYDLDSIKSLTFIGGSLEGNLELKKKDPAYKGNLLAQDETTAMQLLKGRWYAADNDDDMFDYTALSDMFTNDFVQGGEKYMTADIAMEGSNEFVIYIWDGWRATHRYSMEKSDGKQVLEKLQQLATRHKVPGSNVAFDSAGMGNFLRGWLRNAIDFRGGDPAIEDDGVKVQIENLKTQCAYHFAKKVKSYEVCVDITSQEGQNKIVEQFDAHKKLGLNARGKLAMTGKDAVKLLLNGDSPDDFDALTMRSVFDLKKRNRKRGTKAVG